MAAQQIAPNTKFQFASLSGSELLSLKEKRIDKPHCARLAINIVGEKEDKQGWLTVTRWPVE